MTQDERGLIPKGCDAGFELDYEAVLAANDVEVIERNIGHKFWSLSWEHGSVDIWYCSEEIAREAAGLFVYTWIKGVTAPIADRLATAWVTTRNLETKDA